MAEDRRMTAAHVVDKLMGTEHVDVVSESVAWLVGELMEAEVSAPSSARSRPGRVTSRASWPVASPRPNRRPSPLTHVERPRRSVESPPEPSPERDLRVIEQHVTWLAAVRGIEEVPGLFNGVTEGDSSDSSGGVPRPVGGRA